LIPRRPCRPGTLGTAGLQVLEAITDDIAASEAMNNPLLEAPPPNRAPRLT